MTSYLTVITMIAIVAAYLSSTAAASLIARMGFPLPPAEKRIGHIDGLRGYLALSVLMCHFIVWMKVTENGVWESPSRNLFQQLGAGAVGLFFMITGLVFYPRVLKGFRACSWTTVYTTRLFRLMPMIIGSVAIVTVLIILRTGHSIDGEYPIAAAEWISTWDEPPLLSYPDSWRINANVLWSLWCEWLFYLLVLPACALAMDLIRGRLPSWALPIALLAGSLTAKVLPYSTQMLRYLPLFAIGMLAFECQKRNEISKALTTSRATIAAVALIAIGMTATRSPYGVGLPFFGFFFICVACGNDIGGLLKTKGALVLGECSYSVYLLHAIILDVLFIDGGTLIKSIPVNFLPMLLPVVAIAATVLSSITYLLIERPSIRAGSRLAQYYAKARFRPSRQEFEVAP